ncbi:MAG: DUF1015 family protein [Lachnospiraceae bacterium]|nr:DUF1015 family protein [Lachnospiraceae bacterium]
MADFKPFNAIRPKKGLESRVAALPYDVLSFEESKKLGEDRYSFIHVDRAEIDMPEGTDPYDKNVYLKAKENLETLILEGALIKEDKPCFYIYRLQSNGKTKTGIVGLASIYDYTRGLIKKHELTRADKEEDRTNHVDICNAHTGPIFLISKDNKNLSDITEGFIKDNAPIYDFVDKDGVCQKVWAISDEKTINDIIKKFEQIKDLYIADGHHRNAAALNTAKRRRERGEKSDCENYLAVVFQESELEILPYNRLLKDLNGNTSEDLIEKISRNFIVLKADKTNIASKKHEFGLYVNGQWFSLLAKEEIISKDPVKSLDVSILQDYILFPIFGILDPRINERIDFAGGTKGNKYLTDMVDSGEFAAAFSLFPTSVSELMEISDNNMIMPPKSTWFSPKLLSGLFIHSLE